MRIHTSLVLAAALGAGCSKSPDMAPPPANGDGTIRQLVPAATGGTMFSGPLDATLSPEGKTAYFIALTPEGAGIFRSGAPGDGPVRVLASGPPLTAPFGLDVTSDGKTLVIADAGAQVGEDGEDRGQLLTLAVEGGAPSILPGTSGYAPRAVVVMSGSDGDQIYFTGTTPGERMPGVFRIRASGGPVTVLAQGAPFTDPSGIAVSGGGDVFVVDTARQESDQARLIEVQASGATVLLDAIRVGFPAGVALSQDEKTLLISALDPGNRTDVVIRYRIESRETEHISGGIASFSEPAGLHRAKKADTYIWADSSANGGGTVYVINPQP
jgi:DNA-binding beta-propeller fold protein YncE